MTDEHTRNLREGAIFEARMAAAWADGKQTAVDGDERVNPWRGGPEQQPTERVLSRMWAAGYSAGNPMPEPVEDEQDPAGTEPAGDAVVTPT